MRENTTGNLNFVLITGMLNNESRNAEKKSN